MKLIAKTFFGLEEVLASELLAQGAANVKPVNRAVAFEADAKVLYKANMFCRTALRIMRPILSFQATNETDFYNKVVEFDWSSYLSPQQTFAIDVTMNSDYFRHSKFLALKLKDGIVDQIRKKMGKRPSVDVESPDIRLNLHVYKDSVSINLDSSGEILNKRGYRTFGHVAPLNEVLAAGMLALTGWTPSVPLHDPMCGTGTFIIEAAMIASKMAPGILRQKFGFSAWPDYEPEIWNGIRKSALDSVDYSAKANIYGADIYGKSVETAEQSLKVLKLENVAKLEKKPFEKQMPQSFQGILIANPPYGERMEQNDIESFYTSIGDKLKQDFPGYDAWILSGNKEALKKIGLRTSRKLTLYNGPLECKFHRYSLYSGSKKNT